VQISFFFARSEIEPALMLMATQPCQQFVAMSFEQLRHQRWLAPTRNKATVIGPIDAVDTADNLIARLQLGFNLVDALSLDARQSTVRRADLNEDSHCSNIPLRFLARINNSRRAVRVLFHQ
jgi:hypothetical protein